MISSHHVVFLFISKTIPLLSSIHLFHFTFFPFGNCTQITVEVETKLHHQPSSRTFSFFSCSNRLLAFIKMYVFAIPCFDDHRENNLIFTHFLFNKIVMDFIVHIVCTVDFHHCDKLGYNLCYFAFELKFPSVKFTQINILKDSL